MITQGCYPGQGGHDPQPPEVSEQVHTQEQSRFDDSDDSFAARRRQRMLERAAKANPEKADQLKRQASVEWAKRNGYIERQCTECDWHGWVEPESAAHMPCPKCEAQTTNKLPPIDTKNAPPPGGVAKGTDVKRWRKGKMP